MGAARKYSFEPCERAVRLALESRRPIRQVGPRPVKWCTRLSVSSSLEVYAAAAMAITSLGSSIVGSVSAFAIDPALM